MSFGWVASNLIQYPNVSVVNALSATEIVVSDLTVNGTLAGNFTFGAITADSLTVVNELTVSELATIATLTASQSTINSLTVVNELTVSELATIATLTASQSTINSLTVLNKLFVTGVSGDTLTVSTTNFGGFTALTIDGWGLAASNVLATTELFAGNSTLGTLGYLNVYGSGFISSGLRAGGVASFLSHVNVAESVSAANLFVNGTVTGTTATFTQLVLDGPPGSYALNVVDGPSSLGAVTVSGLATFLSSVYVSGGDVTLISGLNVSGNLVVSGATSVQDLTVNGSFSVGGGSLNIDNLNVSGLTTLNSLVVNNLATFASAVTFQSQLYVDLGGFFSTYTDATAIAIGTYSEVQAGFLSSQDSFTLFNAGGDRFLTFNLNTTDQFLTVYYNTTAGGAVQSYNLVPLVNN